MLQEIIGREEASWGTSGLEHLTLQVELLMVLKEILLIQILCLPL